VYQPLGAKDADVPVVVAFHGGGWMFGHLDTAQYVWSEVAAQVPAVVVAGTYRLAPENPAPAALEDAFAITEWAVGHAAELGSGADRVAVMGESSGGTLAASVALRARDSGAFALRFQALIYPSPTSPSPRLRSRSSRISRSCRRRTSGHMSRHTSDHTATRRTRTSHLCWLPTTGGSRRHCSSAATTTRCATTHAVTRTGSGQPASRSRASSSPTAPTTSSASLTCATPPVPPLDVLVGALRHAFEVRCPDGHRTAEA
jgi:acetyl esterase/lipase